MYTKRLLSPVLPCRSYFQAARLLAVQEPSALLNAREIDNVVLGPYEGYVSAWTIQCVPRVLVHPIFLLFFSQCAHKAHTPSVNFLSGRSHHRIAPDGVTQA